MAMATLGACSGAAGDQGEPGLVNPDGGSSGSEGVAPDAAPVRPSLRVLFVGNSYSYDMPQMLAGIASTSQTGPTITADHVVVGSTDLEDHWLAGNAQARISQGAFTHVVLQGQSYEPISGRAAFLRHAKKLGDFAMNAGARATWFVTWAYGKGAFPPATADVDVGWMQDSLTVAYADAMRQVPGSLLACVGEAFRTSLRDHPEVPLHVSDDSHPTIQGKYLTAATIYVAIAGMPVPVESAVPDGIDADAAAKLRSAALVGSNCADVRMLGEVYVRDDSPVRLYLPHGYEVDFGTTATTETRRFFLQNSGGTAAGITDAMMLAPPFTWTTGAYPGGAGTDPGSGFPYCSSSVGPNATCVVSVTFTGSASSGVSTGTLRLNLTNAYKFDPYVELALKGTSTNL